MESPDIPKKEYYLEYNERIPGICVKDLQVDDYLNLETESGSNYVFKVTANDGEKVVIEYHSGSRSLRGSYGTIRGNILEVDDILDYEGKHGGQTSTILGMVVTHGAPYEYPYEKLEYNAYLEELDYSQLKVGDYIYFGTEYGETFVAEVTDISGKRPEIIFIEGKNVLVGGVGKLRKKRLRPGMRLKNTFETTNPVKAMFVLPYLDLKMLDFIEEDCELKDLEYDVEVEEFRTAQLKNGDYIHITTSGEHDYVFLYNNGIVTVIGGNNDFIDEYGSIKSRRLKKNRRFWSSAIVTSPIKSMKVTRDFVKDKSASGLVELMQRGVEHAGNAAMTNPVWKMQFSQPRIWIGTQGNERDREILEVLGISPDELTIEKLEAKWGEFQVHDPRYITNLAESERQKLVYWFDGLRVKYERLLTRLKATREIWKE